MDIFDYIHYHDFKHHFSSCTEWLKQNKGKCNESTDLQLKSIGSSQLDFYIGSLTVELIKTEIAGQLTKLQILDREGYNHWIMQNGGFREITLMDSSVWTLRIIEKEEYIHIHPSRYSPHTIRVKANTLKTVLCTLLFEDADSFIFNVVKINHYRNYYLKLSHIKANTIHKELESIFYLFITNMQDEQ